MVSIYFFSRAVNGLLWFESGFFEFFQNASKTTLMCSSVVVQVVHYMYIILVKIVKKMISELFTVLQFT